MTKHKKKFEKRNYLDTTQDLIDKNTNRNSFERNRGNKIRKVGKKK